MSVDCYFLGKKGVEAVRKISENGKILATEPYWELIELVEARGTDRDEEFVNKFSSSLSNGEAGVYREMLKNEEDFQPTDEELDDMFKLIYLNIPRQIEFSRGFDVSIDEACELESLMWFALDEQLHRKEGEDLFNVHVIGDPQDLLKPSKIGYKIMKRYDKMSNDEKAMFREFVVFAKEFSNNRLQEPYCLEDEYVLNETMMDVCDLILENIGGMNCECVAE